MYRIDTIGRGKAIIVFVYGSADPDFHRDDHGVSFFLKNILIKNLWTCIYQLIHGLFFLSANGEALTAGNYAN